MNLRLLYESHGGEGGIRTPGGRSSRPQRFSRPPPSTTQPPLHYFVSVSLKRRHRVKVEYFSRRTFERHPTKDLHFKGHPKGTEKQNTWNAVPEKNLMALLITYRLVQPMSSTSFFKERSTASIISYLTEYRNSFCLLISQHDSGSSRHLGGRGGGRIPDVQIFSLPFYHLNYPSV